MTMPHLRSRFALVALLLLTALALTLILRTTTTWWLDMGEPGDQRSLWGFFDAEQGDTGSFRWSSPESRMVLHGVADNALLVQLRIYANPFVPEGQTQQVRIQSPTGAGDLAVFEMLPGWRIYTVALPEGTLVTPDEGALQLVLTSDTYRPGPNDGRDLGVAVDWVRVLPQELDWADLGVPLRQALALTWVLALLAGLLWRVDMALRRQREGAVPLWVLALTALGAAGALVWASVNPSGVAQVLPMPVWILGLVTLGVLALHGLPRPWPAAPQRALVLLGLGLLIGAQALFAAQVALSLGVALALAGLVALWFAGAGSPAPTETAPAARFPHAYLLLGLIFLVALGLRLYRITDLPYGLWRDEARHGLVALRMLNDPGYRPAFIPDGGVDLPALGLYPFTLAMQLWGIHTWSMRPITALAGALTVFPLYALAARLTGSRGLGLLAAALLAVSSWHITISRFSFPTVFDPLLTVTALWLTLLGLDQRQDHPVRSWRVWLPCLLAGICVGMAFQTYHTGRLAPLFVGILGLILLLQFPRRWPRWTAGVVVVLVGFVLAASPLLLYALRQPETFNSRVGSVFVLHPDALRGRAPLAVLDDAVGRHLLMFNVRGDNNGRHHAPGRSMLDAVSGIGFLVGCLVATRRWRQWSYTALLLGLALGLVPSLLAVDAPHAMRSIGALAFACILAAVGWREIWRLLVRLWPTTQRTIQHALAPALGVCVAALVLNFWTYFVAMPTNHQVWGAFYPIHTQVGSYVRLLADEQDAATLSRIRVPSGLTRNDVYHYLTYGLNVASFDDGTLATVAVSDGIYIFSGYSYEREVARLADYFGPDPTPVVRGPNLPGSDRPSFVGYQRATSDTIQATSP